MSSSTTQSMPDIAGNVQRIISPATFALAASNGFWKLTRHLELIDDALLDLVSGRSAPILIIEAPPRHGKSEFISKWFPTWYLGRYPSNRIIFSAYGADYAKEYGAACRDMMRDFGPEYFGVNVDKNHGSAGHWQLDGNRGAMYSVGVGGPITGRGANMFIIDDPIKNSADAASETMREKQWNWWTSTAKTRLEPGGKIVIINTRWHRDDLCGRIIKQAVDVDGTPIRRISFPALAEDDDILGRKPGEPLWPERYNADYLNRVKAESGRYYWQAMYQQRPTAHERTVFPEEYFTNILV